MDAATLDKGMELDKALRGFVHDYLKFALSSPDSYELMFGRPSGKAAKPSQELKDTPSPAFATMLNGLPHWLAIHCQKDASRCDWRRSAGQRCTVCVA
jgi:hypothetical protein